MEHWIEKELSGLERVQTLLEMKGRSSGIPNQEMCTFLLPWKPYQIIFPSIINAPFPL